MRPLAIDLCCGTGGWTEGLQAAGWDTIGFDVVRYPEYRWPLVLQDVRTLDGYRLAAAGARLIVASPPCTEFSRLSMPYAFPNAPEPAMDLVEACRRIAREAGLPLVLENVKGAIPYLGPWVARYRSRFLWGDGVPALIWPSAYGSGKDKVSNWGKRAAAIRSRIEPELALWIGQSHLPPDPPCGAAGGSGE